MSMLISGLAIFFMAHLFVGFRGARAAVIARMGALPYRGLFSLLALAGLVLIVMGKAQAPFESIWLPPEGIDVVTKLLMLPAMVFLVVAYIPCNLRTRLKHPMLIAVKIWATVHLMVNGDLASILLFGSFLVYAAVTMIRLNRRDLNEPAEPAPEYPFWRDIVAIVVGGAAYALVGLYHAQLFGVAIH